MSDYDGKQSPPKDFSASFELASPASYEKGEIAPQSKRERLWQHLCDDVRTKHVDYVVLLCWFVTGLLDGTIFNAYRTFVSMQTGNTMFIGLGASNFNTTTRPYGWAKSLVSLIFFLAGCYLFPRFSRRYGSLRRWTLIVSFLVQAAVIFIAAIVIQTGLVEGRLEKIGDEIDWRHLVPIALLSIQAPGQLCLCRDLSLLEVPTLVVTTVIYDFAADPKLIAPLNANRVRNRRFFGFVMILMGAIAGGWISKNSGHITITLWADVAIKACIAIAWVFWPAQEERPRRWSC